MGRVGRDRGWSGDLRGTKVWANGFEVCGVGVGHFRKHCVLEVGGWSWDLLLGLESTRYLEAWVPPFWGPSSGAERSEMSFWGRLLWAGAKIKVQGCRWGGSPA